MQLLSLQLQSYPLKPFKHSTESFYTQCNTKQSPHIKIALGYVGVVEKEGNRGVVIDSINRKYAYIGAPYCASFISWILNKADKIKKVLTPKIRTARARKFITKNSISASEVLLKKIKLSKKYIVIWGKGNTPFGHGGFTYKNWLNGKGQTIEANTSSGKKGSQRNGTGIWIRTRKIEPLNYFRIIAFTAIEYKGTN